MSHIDPVWVDTTFGNLMPECFVIFHPIPTDTSGMKMLRNLSKLKHVNLGKKIWNALTPKYEIEISGKRSEFKREQRV